MTFKFQTGEYAHLAKGAYKGAPVKGWAIDRELSGKNHTVYVKNGHAVVAFSGTRKTHVDDWKADAAIAFGTHHRNHRFHEALNTIRHVRHKYGHDAVETTGHSLGGSLGMYTSDKLGVPAMVFQPGVSPFVNYNKADYSKVQAHVDDNDPISNSAKNISANTGIKVYQNPDKNKSFWSVAGRAIKDFTRPAIEHVKKHPFETAKEVFDAAAAVAILAGSEGKAAPAEARYFGGSEYERVAQEENEAVDDLEHNPKNVIKKVKDNWSNIKRIAKWGMVGSGLLNDAVQAGQAHQHDPDSYPNKATDDNSPLNPQNIRKGTVNDPSLTPSPDSYATSVGSDGTSNTYYSAASQYNYADTSVGPLHAATYQPYARAEKPRAHSRRAHRQSKGSRRSVRVYA